MRLLDVNPDVIAWVPFPFLQVFGQRWRRIAPKSERYMHRGVVLRRLLQQPEKVIPREPIC